MAKTSVATAEGVRIVNMCCHLVVKEIHCTKLLAFHYIQ